MKVCIAGSTIIYNKPLVYSILRQTKFQITEVVSGLAKGVDTLGYEWAKENKIPVLEYPADWKKYGKQAGMLRNAEMAKVADALILIWTGASNGSKNMKELMDGKLIEESKIDVPPFMLNKNHNQFRSACCTGELEPHEYYVLCRKCRRTVDLTKERSLLWVGL